MPGAAPNSEHCQVQTKKNRKNIKMLEVGMVRILLSIFGNTSSSIRLSCALLISPG